MDPVKQWFNLPKALTSTGFRTTVLLLPNAIMMATTCHIFIVVFIHLFPYLFVYLSISIHLCVGVYVCVRERHECHHTCAELKVTCGFRDQAQAIRLAFYH